MTLYQFNALKEPEKAEVIKAHGVELAQRVDEEHRITLYQIDGFYVEVYRSIQDDVITRYRSFSSANLLDPYTDQIDINKLLE